MSLITNFFLELSQNNGLFSVFFLLGSAFVALLSRNQIIKVLFYFIIGFYWTSRHNGPPPPKSGVAIVHSNQDASSFSTLIVKLNDQHYAVKGFGAYGDHGAVHCQPSNGLFSKSFCLFKSNKLWANQKTPTALRTFYELISEQISRYPHNLACWLKAIFLGNKNELPKDVISTFKKTGTYHLLVVSGLHLSMLCVLFAYFIKIPLIILYTAKAIKPHHWINIVILNECLSCIFAILFMFLVGLSSLTFAMASNPSFAMPAISKPTAVYSLTIWSLEPSMSSTISTVCFVIT